MPRLIGTRTPVLIFNTHPIQYFSPLYRVLAESDILEPTVLYYRDMTTSDGYDPGFGHRVEWDIPLREGFRSQVLRRWSPAKWQRLTFCPGALLQVAKARKPIVVVHGWMTLTDLMLIVLAPLLGGRVVLRCEAPLMAELARPQWLRRTRAILFRMILARACAGLAIGSENRAFYATMRPSLPVLSSPYAIDNARFAPSMVEGDSRPRIRAALGINAEAIVGLVVGKLVKYKHPGDVIRAVSLSRQPVEVVFVGSGSLETSLRALAEELGVTHRVHFAGFVNQRELPEQYAAADFLIQAGSETWGLTVNEAMASGLPVVVSDRTGSATDLVREGVTGFSFATGSILALAHLLDHMASMLPFDRQRLGQAATEHIAAFSFEESRLSLEKLAAEL